MKLMLGIDRSRSTIVYRSNQTKNLKQEQKCLVLYWTDQIELRLSPCRRHNQLDDPLPHISILYSSIMIMHIS